MIKAWNAADVYAAEDAAMAGLDEGELMARAVAGLAEIAATRLDQRGGRGVVALVGPGNNGADALYAAADLARRGFNVAAVHIERVHTGAAGAADAAGVIRSSNPAEAIDLIGGADLVLDGILGIGGRGGLPDWALPWVEAIPPDAWVIAVDTPSGQVVDGGPLAPTGVFADETVTFSLGKPVHLLPPSEAACGLVSVVDIGIAPLTAPAVCRLVTADVPELWPIPSATDDKYSRGVVGMVAGSERYPGAAVLAVTAAVEAGIGMVRYLGPPTPSGLVRAAVPEAVHGPGQVQAWVVGPGLDGTDEDPTTPGHVSTAVAVLRQRLPCVVDAGGLDLLEPALLAARHGIPTLLTPHAGECARLLSRLGAGEEIARESVEADPLRHARELAELTGATVLLKGAGTLVVPPDPGAAVFSQADAPAWLATAGAGDVLAGIAGALLAGGLSAVHAGALAALVHGLAAERANPGGPVRALGVAHAIPVVVATVLAAP